jgi:uncharacterized protein with ParB-like and HNH nuclease domain
VPTLIEVIDEIEAGFYTVPEIQRRFVWKNPQIRDLISSIYHNHPIGAIVYWKIQAEKMEKENLRDLFRPLEDNLPLKNGSYVIIDGQQRLTSLLLVKKGEISTSGKKRKIKLYFNPIEERFELGSRDIEKDPKWFNVTEVLNSNDIYKLIEDQAQKFNDDSIKNNPKIREKLLRLQENFKTYEIPLISAKLSYSDDFLSTFEEISTIFINLNSTGTRIRLPDLALALLTARMRKDIGDSFRKKFEELLQRMEDLDFPVDEAVLIRLYSAIATGTTRFNEARKELEKKSGQEIDNLLKDTGKAIEETVKLLKRNGVKSKFLQSRYLLIPIAYLLHRDIISVGKAISEETEANIMKWFLLASVEKRYTGRLETDLLSDIQQIGKGKSFSGLMENLRMKEIPLSQLEGDFDNYHLTLLLILYCKLKTKDWNIEARPNIREVNELDPEDLQIHHVFPEEFLSRRGYTEKWDNFGNITLISKKANNYFKFKDPSVYLNELKNIEPELLKKQFIPMDSSLWNINNYDKFLKERISLIADAIETLGIKVLKSSE